MDKDLWLDKAKFAIIGAAFSVVALGGCDKFEEEEYAPVDAEPVSVFIEPEAVYSARIDYPEIMTLSPEILRRIGENEILPECLALLSGKVGISGGGPIQSLEEAEIVSELLKGFLDDFVHKAATDCVETAKKDLEHLQPSI